MGSMSFMRSRAAEVLEDQSIPWHDFMQKSVLITGSTGLIGQQIVRTLLAADDLLDLSIELLLPSRNIDKVNALFGNDMRIHAIAWQLGERLPDSVQFDYCIHAASPTQSSSFVEAPVETIISIVYGWHEILEAARRSHVDRMLFLSSMEVYGSASGRISEEDMGPLDPLSVRSSYPEAKRLCECLCVSYFSEYGVPGVIARLAQTFGEGVMRDDKRVFAEFGRCAKAGKDIVLLTDGSKVNPYVSVRDAVRALLLLLLVGEPGKAYNVANENTCCSVRDMAELVVKTFSPGISSVRFANTPETAAHLKRFPVPSSLDMDVSRLRALGWEALDSLVDTYEAMFASWDAEAIQ